MSVFALKKDAYSLTKKRYKDTLIINVFPFIFNLLLLLYYFEKNDIYYSQYLLYISVTGILFLSFMAFPYTFFVVYSDRYYLAYNNLINNFFKFIVVRVIKSLTFILLILPISYLLYKHQINITICYVYMIMVGFLIETFFIFSFCFIMEDCNVFSAIWNSFKLSVKNIHKIILFNFSFIGWIFISSLTLSLSNVFLYPYYSQSVINTYEQYKIS